MMAAAAAVAWVPDVERLMQWHYESKTWYTQYWARPTININLAQLRDTTTWTVRYWAGTLVHELLHQMGHHHPKGQFLWATDTCLEFEGDVEKVLDAKRTGIR